MHCGVVSDFPVPPPFGTQGGGTAGGAGGAAGGGTAGGGGTDGGGGGDSGGGGVGPTKHIGNSSTTQYHRSI